METMTTPKKKYPNPTDKTTMTFYLSKDLKKKIMTMAKKRNTSVSSWLSTVMNTRCSMK